MPGGIRAERDERRRRQAGALEGARWPTPVEFTHPPPPGLGFRV